jgi:glycogen synthase
MRVVCIAAECEPWAKTGGLGDVVDALARAVGATGKVADEMDAAATAGGGEGNAETQASGAAIAGLDGHRRGDGRGQGSRQICPGTSSRRWTSSCPAIAALPSRTEPRADLWRYQIRLAEDGTTEVTLVEFEDRGYRVRLVDHPPAFDREGYYGDSSGDYPDNGWRFGLLCRAAIEALLADERPVDVLHLHDWQSMPTVILRDYAYEGYPLISRAAVMVTIHNLAYQGWLTRAQVAGCSFRMN